MVADEEEEEEEKDGDEDERRRSHRKGDEEKYGANESRRFQRRVGAFVSAYNRKIMHRFFQWPREKLKLMRCGSRK